MTLHIHTSTTADGSMKIVPGSEASIVDTHRAAFLQSNSIDPEATTLVRLLYEGDDYARYSSAGPESMGDGITRESTIVCDGLVTTEQNHALFLPLADCIGAVIHDTAQNILMVSHLGRHNLEQFGGTKNIEYLIAKYGSKPESITVWLSPAAGKTHYPLFAFENRGLHEVAVEQLLAAGIVKENVTVSPIDVAADTRYFSHSQFLKGNRETDGRFAIVAVLS